MLVQRLPRTAHLPAMHRLVLGLLTLSCWVVAAEARAFCRLTTAAPSGGACSNEGRPLEWERRCVSYTVVPRDRDRDDIDLEVIRDTIDDSFAVWTDVACGDEPLPIALGQTDRLGACKVAQYNQFGPNANTIMFLSTWQGKDFPREAFGLTLVWHDPQSGEIFDADMQLNETIAPIGICGESCGHDVVDLSNVVTHEAGHFLGLGHSNVIGATMSANALLGETAKRSLEEDDQLGICAIYGGQPQPSCDDGDYAPDRGFTPVCGGAEEESACSVRAPGSQPLRSNRLWIAALVLLAVRTRRGLQRALVSTSRARPKPMSK